MQVLVECALERMCGAFHGGYTAPYAEAMKAVVTTAGFSTRLFPATKAIPKAMLPLGRKPILQHVMEELAEAGFDDVALLYRPEQWCAREHFETPAALRDYLRKNAGSLVEMADEIDGLAKFTFIDCSGSTCFGEALLRTADFVNQEPFLLALSDEIGPCIARPSLSSRLLAAYRRFNCSIVAYDTLRVRPEQVCHEPHKLRAIRDLEWTAGDNFIVGRFLFGAGFIAELARWQRPEGFLDYLSALNVYGERDQLVALPFSDGWWHCGTHAEYQKAFIDYALGGDSDSGDVALFCAQARFRLPP
jgi:UTP-glucose-1-phosphate uridylyltransferase